MPVIRISDQSFDRLKKLAEPFVDTPGSVIEKLLDHFERTPNKNNGIVPPNPPPEKVPSCSPRTPPDLTHTNIRSAQFNGQSASNWNELRRVSHRVAFDKLGNFEAVRSATKSSIVRGRKSDEGYRYIPEIDVSIRGEGAVRAWVEIFHLAVKLNVSVWVEFEWQNKAAAALPGERRHLRWSPQT